MYIKLIILMLASSVMLQKGKTFPSVTGTTLNNKKVVVPADLKGKEAVICLAQSKKSENDLKTWMEPLYNKYVAKTELMADDVHIYFMPLLSGIKSASGTAVIDKLKKETDPSLYGHVLVVKENADALKPVMLDKSIPHIYVLNKDGKVVYWTTGAYSEDKMDKIEDALN